VASTDEATIEMLDISEKKPDSSESPPRDALYLVHLLFLLFGIMHLLPISFFVTANDYWMYKFRNTSASTIDPNDRSQFQSHFASGSIIAQSVPTVICLVLSTIFAYKIRARPRVLASLAVLACSFLISTAFIKVVTDTWQAWFFATTMAILAIMNGVLALFQVSSFALLSKFPSRYMKTFLIGQGVGGIFSSALQVLSLAIATSSEASAIIYFTLGSVLTSSTLLLYYFSDNLAYYRYQISNSVEDTKRDIISGPEFKDVSCRIWSSLVIVTAGALAFVPTHPSIAALVVSEYQGQGYAWNDKYFVAVVTFLFSDICALIGRVVAAAFTKTLSGTWLSVISVLRMVAFVPLFIFCNALPRKHLPVLFPHDWQYILILGSFFVSSGYLFNIAFLNVTKLAPGKEETAYLLLQTCIGIVGAVFSPVGVVCVNIL
ncbi:hypothetical protein NQ315_011730, partial [Exocentrus adspersus]